MKPLEPGEVICDKCDGTGREDTIKNNSPYAVYKEIPIQCNKCHGD